MANRTSAAKARSTCRQVAALQLRGAGLSYAAIAARVGVGKTQAFRLITAALAQGRPASATTANEARVEEISRLDGMLVRLYPRAARGDVAAIDRVLKIGERRARLLGLDAPARAALGQGREEESPTRPAPAVVVYMPASAAAPLADWAGARARPDAGARGPVDARPPAGLLDTGF